MVTAWLSSDLTKLDLNSKEQKLSWEANSCSASQEIPSNFCILRIHHRVHTSSPFIPKPDEPSVTLSSQYFEIYFNINLPQHALYMGIKRPGREADHSPPSSAEVKNGGAIPPLPHVSFHSTMLAQLSTGTTLPLTFTSYSTLSIVSRLRTGRPGNRGSVFGWDRGLSLHGLQTGSGAHSASIPVGRDSSVSIATDYRLDDLGSIPGRSKIFLFITPSRQVLGPTQPPIQWVPGALSPGAKRPMRQVDHSSRCKAEVYNAWSYAPTPSHMHYIIWPNQLNTWTPLPSVWPEEAGQQTGLYCGLRQNQISTKSIKYFPRWNMRTQIRRPSLSIHVTHLVERTPTKTRYDAASEVLTPTTIKSIFWNMAPCSLVDVTSEAFTVAPLIISFRAIRRAGWLQIYRRFRDHLCP
jgi:hypothetical protein